MIACCLVLNGWSDLWSLLCLVEEVFLLEQCIMLPVTRLLPYPTNLYVFASIYLSSSNLTSLGTAYSPIPLSRPFILTLSMLEYLYIIWYVENKLLQQKKKILRYFFYNFWNVTILCFYIFSYSIKFLIFISRKWPISFYSTPFISRKC